MANPIDKQSKKQNLGDNYDNIQAKIACEDTFW